MKGWGFCGPSYTARSPNIAVQRSINLYPESVIAGEKSKLALIGTPGLSPFVILGDLPVRQLFYQDGRAFAVAGGTFYELFANKTSKVRGLVANGTRPVTIVSNGPGGGQLLIVSSPFGYVFNLSTNILTQITDPNFPSPATMGVFTDGYGIALRSGSTQFNLSSLEDFTMWNGLDVAQISEGSDYVLSIIINQRTLWLFGSKTTEIWYNSGDPSFPFQPIQGTFIEQGIIAPFSAVRLDNSLFWLGGDERGAGVVYRAAGYTPIRVSTHAIEYVWAHYPTITDAIGFAYQDEGHTFYWLYFPSAQGGDGGTSWVYDITTQQWHERAFWNEQLMHWEPHMARCHAYAFNQHLVGDRQSGGVYTMSLDTYQDTIVLLEPLT